MAKLYYRYGVMGSSKTAQALMTKFNYEERGRYVWLLKPSADTRDGKTIIKSRIGLSAEADVVNPEDNIIELFKKRSPYTCVDTIICDEAQFLTEKQINQLRYMVDNWDIPVFCYGLRTDFQTHLFEGSRRLFEIADSISEMKSICQCGNKATINARIDDSGNVITEGSQIEVGGNDKYIAMCSCCYFEKIHKENENVENM